MAQYYQIVGQAPSLTLEDLQRYCPNIRLDGIIVNQDEQQYAQPQVVVQQTEQPNDIIVSEGVQQQLVVSDGMQYQQQYIIRHEPPAQQCDDFQQQQQIQQPQQQQQQPPQQQQQAIHRHQVYYTSDLPVDAQVVLQEAQQIIDAASLMQQSTSQRPQHQLVNPGHVLSQPTVIHPAQQPPPQPPPSTTPTQHAAQQPQQQQQLSRASPQLIQHLQQQQQQLHLQQLQQRQLQQQQLQQHLQQQQQQQQQHQQIQHQQVVMHAAYINQSGAATRQPQPRVLNQALGGPATSGTGAGVAVLRGQVRAARPRRLTARSHLPPNARLLNPHPQVNPAVAGGAVRPAGAAGAVGVTVRSPAPRLLNPQAQHVQHPRPPRPRTPLHHQIQQHQQHQLAQHVLGQQVQQVHQQQLDQLKLSSHQIINQQNQSHPQQARIITPQGTIVTQNLQSQMPQHMVLQTTQTSTSQHPNNIAQQNTINAISQRSSPHPPQQQVKKVVVQPNNASDMDDLEESITAAILQKHPVNENTNVQQPQQYHAPSPTVRHNHASGSVQLNFTQQNFQQQQQMLFEQQQNQPHIQQQGHAQSITQLLMEPDNIEEERQVLTLNNGQRITLSDFKRLQQTPRATLQQQQSRESGRQTLLRSKEQPRPVQRVPPLQTQQIPQHENSETPSGPSEETSEPLSAKMLIFLQNGEQRLITFTLPKESCTLQEVLEQVHVPFSEDTHIQCMQNTSSEIDYFVSVGSTTRIEEMLENHPMLVGDINSRSSPSVLSQPVPHSQSSEMSTPEKTPCPDNASSSPESPGARSPPPRLVDGMLALCKSCGYTGFNFSKCERCKRVFTEEPKSVPIASKKVEQKKKEPEKQMIEKQITEKHNACGEGIKLNLLKTTSMKTYNKNATPEKKPARVRKVKGKQPDPEPVILTLSSDEEDSNSSISNQYEHILHMKEPSLNEIENGTSDSGIGLDNPDDGSREEISKKYLQGIVTSLNCRTIRIGSYRYTPREKVYISSKGIKIVAPSLKNDSKEVALQIQLKEVVKILVHFGKGLPVIFVYLMSKCGVYVRKALDMVEDAGPYYDPMSRVDPYKRITLLPEIISDEVKVTLKTLFGKAMDELNSREANDILVRTCPKESNNVTKMATRSLSASLTVKSANPAEIRQILIYPPGKGGIPINTEDYMCLAQDQFLNDVIIDFYLKYLVHDILTHSQREKTHIFSTFFYKRLTTKPSKMNKSSNPHEWDSNLSPAQKRHARVKTWTKNVNIFEKDFIVVPINENCHWFVAIICYPSLDGCRSMVDNRSVTPQEIKKRERRSSMQIGNTTITPLTKQEQLTLSCDSDNLSERDEAEAEESDLDMQCDSEDEENDKTIVEKKVEPPVNRKNEPIKQPCILIFDSLAGASRSRVVATLRDYLTCEYQAKVSQNKIFTKDNIKGSCPKIPQQNNFTDCGLYLLQYVEQFFKDPIIDYNLPIKQLANWFDEIVVTRKREDISNLLKILMHKYNPDSHLNLPDITFPTLNGKLIEPEEHDEGSESDRGNSSSSKTHKLEGKECDVSTLTFVKQIPASELLMKRNFGDPSDTIHVRKTIRLSSDPDSRSMVQIKQEFIKKGESENQIIIPIKLQSASDFVKDIHHTLIVNKNNKSVGDKKHGVHNQNVSHLNCVRQNVSENDSNNSFLKSRKTNKLDDALNESCKKFKRNEC